MHTHTHTLCSQSPKLISPLFHFICLSAYFLPSYIHFSSLPSLPLTFFCQTHLSLLFFLLFPLNIPHRFSPSVSLCHISVSISVQKHLHLPPSILPPPTQGVVLCSKSCSPFSEADAACSPMQSDR